LLSLVFREIVWGVEYGGLTLWLQKYKFKKSS
jgi:hypothetical protein